MIDLHRQIKYQEELDPGFLKEIEALEGGENLRNCIQCGTCSGICPMSIYMDIPPRQIIAMVREGFKDEVLSSFTIWLCASCYACSVHCPEQIKITDIMYALKRKAIEEKKYPKRFPIPVLSKEFFNMVIKSGRNSELRLILRVWMKVNIAKLFSFTGLGLDLLRTKRISLKQDRIKNNKELAIIMDNLNGKS